MGTGEHQSAATSRPTNQKDSVTPAQPGNSADSERELPTTAERVSESYDKYPDRMHLPLASGHGVSLRREYTNERYEEWDSDVVDEMDDEVSGHTLVERWPITWGEAVEKTLENHEETRRTTVNLQKGYPDDLEYATFSIDAVTRWFASYQQRYYAQMEGWLRELSGGERPSGGSTEGIYDNPHVCLLTLSASSVPDGERVPPIDHENARTGSWSDVYDAMRNTMRALGFGSSKWQYDRRTEPHTGKRGSKGLNSCYGHDHVVLVIDGDISPGDLRPIIEKHVERCAWAGPDAHDLDVEDWDANREDVGTVEIKDPNELENVAAYVADYCSIDPLDLHERSVEYVAWASAVTAANTKTVTRSDATGWASTADACKQRFESDKSEQSVDHGEEVIRSDRRGAELECVKCGSPHEIDQNQTLTAARVSSSGSAAADGGLDREGDLRDRWPSARAAAYVGQTPQEKKDRERIERYLERHPDATPNQVLGALGLPPDARSLIQEVDLEIDPTEPVAFEQPPDWRVVSVTIGEEEFPASSGTGIEMVETVDSLDHIYPETKLSCENSDSILWRCEKTGVSMWGGLSMARYLSDKGITHTEIIDEIVHRARVPDESGSGTIAVG